MTDRYYWRPIDAYARSGEEILLANSAVKAVYAGFYRMGTRRPWATAEGVHGERAFDIYCPMPPFNLRPSARTELIDSDD